MEHNFPPVHDFIFAFRRSSTKVRSDWEAFQRLVEETVVQLEEAKMLLNQWPEDI